LAHRIADHRFAGGARVADPLVRRQRSLLVVERFRPLDGRASARRQEVEALGQPGREADHQQHEQDQRKVQRGAFVHTDSILD
jgi:hypothetical protein